MNLPTTNTRQKIRIFIATSMTMLTAVYVFAQSKDVISGPIIDISHPQNHATVTERSIEVTGTATNVAYISINDKQIFVDEDSVFSKHLVLSPGYTIIEVYARDKFGKETTELVEVVYTQH